MVSYNRRPERWKKAKKRKRVDRLCVYCKRQLTQAGTGQSTSLTRDHFVPKSQGGRITYACCLACNNLKGDMLPWEWREFTDANPQWWKLWKGNRS